MVVENAGFGAQNAAPIARRVFDFMINGQYPSEADIAATKLGQSTVPTGQPRPIASVPLPGTTVDGTVGGLTPAASAPVPAAAASPASSPTRVALVNKKK